MTTPETALNADEAAPLEIPANAQPLFLGVAGLGFLLLAGFVLVYGLYGGVVLAGLDQACARAAFKSGQNLEALGNHEQAIQRFRQAMEGRFSDEKERHMCGLSIGDLLYRQGRYAEAISAYVSLPPAAFSAAGAYTGYANALWKDKRLGDAEQVSQAWLGLAQSEGNQEQRLWANNVLMRIADETGRSQAVLAYGAAVLGLDAGSEARIVMARALHRQGKTAEALAEIETFIETSTDPKLLEEARALGAQLRADAPG